MKQFFLLTSLLMISFLWEAHAQESETNIQLRIENADGKVIEKTYESEEALENDPELEKMGIHVEAEDGGIKVRTEGDSKVMISRRSGGDDGNVFIYQNAGRGNFFSDSIPFPPAPPLPPHIIRLDSTGFAFGDSLGEMPAITFFRMHESREELDSLFKEMKHRRFEMRAMRDSLRRGHMQEMKAAQEEMRAEMQEMRQQMQEMKRQLREERQYIVVENLSREEAEKFEVEEQELALEELQFYPNPSDGELSVQFEAPDSSPVQLQLTDASGRTLYEQTVTSENRQFEEELELEEQESGIYILHIIQNAKVLSRKIMLR